MALTLVNCTIAAGQSLSNGVALTAGRLVRIRTPAAWKSANLTFQVASTDVPGEYHDVYTRFGEEIVIASVEPNTVIALPAEVTAFLQDAWIKIRSGHAGLSVPQNAACDFELVLLQGTLDAVLAAKVAKAGDTMTGALTIANATASTSTTTGALTVVGGLGVAGTVNVGGNVVVGRGGSTAGLTNTPGSLITNDGAILSECGGTSLALNRTGANGSVAAFAQGTTFVGSITVANGTSTAFNTSSDGRLKDDTRAFNSGALIDRLEALDFRWRANGERAYGVIAQDAAKVVPQACHYDEQSDRWGTDYSKFVPLLLAEVKALRMRMAELEGRS